ncbi:MAG: response regulator [Myxococcales bacterium]|nr:response regulator [Myxococcales bacterium]
MSVSKCAHASEDSAKLTPEKNNIGETALTQENKTQETLSPASFHGLNNHLAACKGYTELLLKTEGLPKEAHALVARLKQGFDDAISCSMELERTYKPHPFASSAPSPKEKEAPSAPEEQLGGCETLLLVEDDEAFREMLTSYLKRRGYTVLRAENGEQGLQALQEHSDDIDAVLLDRHMPRCDGLEFLELMRKDNPRLRVLMLSGNDLDQERAFLEKYGATTHLKKPFPLKELARTLRQLLEGPAPQVSL